MSIIVIKFIIVLASTREGELLNKSCLPHLICNPDRFKPKSYFEKYSRLFEQSDWFPISG